MIPNSDEYLDSLKSKLTQINSKIDELNTLDQDKSKSVNSKISAILKFEPNTSSLERILREKNRMRTNLDSFLKSKESLSQISEKVTDDASTSLAELAAEASTIQTKINRKKKSLRELRFKEDEFQANVNKYKPRGTEVSEKERFQAYGIMDILERAIEKTIESYKSKAVKDVEELSSKVFLQLTNSPGGFKGISLDKNFKSKIIGSNGREVVGISSGMEVIMTLSVIEGLRIVSV